LGRLGWTTVTFPQPPSLKTANHVANPEEGALGIHPLQQASAALFEASQQFFDLPSSEKQKWKTRLGSEEGWSSIPGEKEFITLRTLSYTPDVLKEPAKRYWDLMGTYLDSCLGRISTSLGLPDHEDRGLRVFVGPCKSLGQEEEHKTATMLRLFRYEGWEEKVVAEPHADLGLLSIVVGDVPGLEVWNGERFVAIEKSYERPCATLLGGRQLERLSNFRYPAGGHRVVSYGLPEAKTHSSLPLSPTTPPPKYRHSIVFVLRAYEPAIVNSDLLESNITGKWQEPVRDLTAGKMYEQIRNAHFNINTGLEEREKQKRDLTSKKIMGTG